MNVPQAARRIRETIEFGGISGRLPVLCFRCRRRTIGSTERRIDMRLLQMQVDARVQMDA